MVLVSLTITMCVIIVESQGIQDPAVLAFPSLMIFASMFTNRRAFFTMVGFVFFVLFLVVTSNVLGLHTSRVSEVSFRTLGYSLSILSVTAFFVWLMATDLRKTMKKLVLENEKIRKSNIQIEILARHDSLTGLSNRLESRDQFDLALGKARANNSSIALLYFDLDDFKSISDSLGHQVGDVFLCEVAKRLKTFVRDGDIICRHGGDEFLIGVTGAVSETTVKAMVGKIIEVLVVPFYIEGVELLTTCSIGIAMFPKDGNDFDTLLKWADMAMYRAKAAGRNTYKFFDETMSAGLTEHLQLVSGIRAALAKNEFELYYQPQYRLRNNRIIGAEALLRWNHREFGFIPPTKFVAAAERSGLIHELGRWVIHEACRQTKEWQNSGIPNLVVAINISPLQFRRDQIERDVINALSETGLAPRFIELELTESLLMGDSNSLKEMMFRLRTLGLRLSIDDFGTGYSNLSYLESFDVHCLKIDQSFIRRMTGNVDDSGIVRAIIEMAHSVGLYVVAEGIEDESVLTRLIELGCEYGQGFYWSPALQPEEFISFYQNHQSKLDL